MVDKDVYRHLRALRRQAGNLSHEDVERAAVRAGWVFDRHGKKGHAVYVKEGFWANLSIPLHPRLKKRMALRLLSLIESSLFQEEVEE